MFLMLLPYLRVLSTPFVTCTGGWLNISSVNICLFKMIFFFLRRFIAPYLFGRKEKTLKDAVEEMNKNVTRLIGDVTAAVQNLSSTVATLQSNQNEKSDIKELKAELASMKALLLSR